MKLFRRPVEPYVVSLDAEELRSYHRLRIESLRRMSTKPSCCRKAEIFVGNRSRSDGEVGGQPSGRTRLFDVPVVVDEERCIKGCHICVESCPVDCLAIAPATGKSHMKYDDCWYCLACEVDCPTNAITVKIPILIR